jgi:hypothetical protein
MKKSVLLISILVLFLFPVIAAQLNNTQVTNGFACLNTKIGDCSALSIGEQIFTSLADGKCTSLIAGSSNNGCWPSNSCDIKTTAQAVLALQNSGLSTSQSLSWLTSQETKTSDINWFMQINTNSNASCTVSYSGGTPTITINPDRTLSITSDNCLSVSPSGDWLSISPNCFGTPFTITCNQAFTTTNLYQRQNYPTIYVSSSSNSASSGGKVTDVVNSSCFGSGNSCNYEATLWASLALNSVGASTSSFLPYLTAEASDTTNQQYLPYSFLYALTSSSDYLNTLLSEQKTVNTGGNTQNYWDQSSPYGPYYDTALALLPLESQNPQEKSNAIDWLMNTQGSDGCWDSILDTAFVLYSLSGSTVQHTSTIDCISAGNYCIAGVVNCQQAGGTVIQGDSCTNTLSVCCTKNVIAPLCASQNGVFCTSGQSCSGQIESASDTISGKTCCVGGSCSNPVLTQSACESSGGSCQSSCNNNQQSLSQTCALTSEVCCITQQGSNTIWIWILLILIVLVLIGILFRKKLRVLWFRIKSKFTKGGGKPQPGYQPRPPFPPRPPMSFQRRPLPPQPPRQQQKPSEINDVLKKLKEIGK